MKRLASLLLSLLLFLSLSAPQAKAVDLPEPAGPPAQVEVLDPENPDEPDEPGTAILQKSCPDKDDGSSNRGERS